MPPKQLPRKGWYDGWIYATFIDREQNPTRDLVIEQLKPGTSILDVGCATGKFAIKLAQHGFKVSGVDISEEMIRLAREHQLKSGLENVDFIHSHASYLFEQINETYDYAIFSFSIHEITHQERLEMISSIKPLTRQIVFCDYQTPPPSTIFGLGVWGIEFLAGSEHFENFKDFEKRGGLDSLINECNLKKVKEAGNPSGIYRIVVCDI